jgi:monomeric sarcosine oxidase
MFDAAVIGLGAAGSATLAALARAGARTIGVDRSAPPHAEGSSHGETRLLRVAYAEGAQYVPMARRAIELWRALEAHTGTELFRQTGVVYAGPKSSPFLAASLASAREHTVAVDDIPSADRARLAAVLNIPRDWRCCIEREGGYLFAEKAMMAFLADARAHGAEVRTNTRCSVIQAGENAVHIATGEGVIRAEKCVVAAGAWAAELMPALAAHLHIERKTLHWYADPGAQYAPGGFRPFLVDDENNRQVYGFPDCGTGVKIAEHTAPSRAYGRPADIVRAVAREDVERMDPLVRERCPALGPRLRSVTCLYPMSKDGHFILDRHPGRERIVIAAGLSGHGFKFAPAIGEALANLAFGRAQKVDLAPFALSRF